MKKKKFSFGSVLLMILLIAGYWIAQALKDPVPTISLDAVPAYSGQPYVVLENNIPRFSEKDYVTESYETYGSLDHLGRCTQAVACIGRDLMPTEERGAIGQIKPSGWQIAKYDFVDGKYLYNRCHLIGYQLTAENANERNLITGTRYLNVDGMLPFENMVADYIKQTGNHVLYRVIPIFDGSNLVASGLTMEGWSVEDSGAGICFYVYVYNVQPGVEIDYGNGDSQLAEPLTSQGEPEKDYIVNMSSGKFHLDSCSQAENIKPENRESFTTTRSQMLAWAFVPAGCCNP